MICISIGNSDLVDEVNELKPDLVELRFDLIKQEPRLIMPLIDKEINIVATCRPGYYTEGDRLGILQDSISLGAKYVDVELEASDNYVQKIIDCAQSHSVKTIVSYHNYKITPEIDELRMIFRSCTRKGADIVKIATWVNADIDNIHLLGLYTEEKAEKVILGMGEMGKITRVAAMELGGEFTFASLGSNEETAPGQLCYDELIALRKILHSS